MDDHDRTASIMTPAKLAQVRPKAAVNPAAWLDQMATDAGHQHVERLTELRAILEKEAAGRNLAPLGAELNRVAETLPRLDFGLLQNRGFLARLSGKSKNAGAEFGAQFERIESSLKSLLTQTRSLQKEHSEQSNRTDLTLLEFEVEYRAIEKIIDQGARWLHDMRTQLKAREAAGPTEAEKQKIREDAGRCELLVTRLKALRAIASAAQQSHQQAQGTAARRGAIMQTLEQAFAADVREWRNRIAPVAAAAADGTGPALSLEAPMECHRELQLCIKQLISDCGQLQAHEQAFGESLAVLGSQLGAAAR